MNAPADTSDPALTDAEIIRASVDDPSAFGGIFHRHYDAISRYAHRRMPSDAADDLASDVFVIAYERRATFDESYSSAAPWLFGIVANLIRHRVRQERREWNAYARAYEPPVVEADTEAADSRADAKAAVASVVGALRALRPDERECLLLTAWAGLTNAEIAVALDMSVGTVKTNIYRARQRLASARGELLSVGVRPMRSEDVLSQIRSEAGHVDASVKQAAFERLDARMKLDEFEQPTTPAASRLWIRRWRVIPLLPAVALLAAITAAIAVPAFWPSGQAGAPPNAAAAAITKLPSLPGSRETSSTR